MCVCHRPHLSDNPQNLKCVCVLLTDLKDALQDPGGDQQVDAPGGEHRCEQRQNGSQ